jgi:transposase
MQNSSELPAPKYKLIHPDREYTQPQATLEDLVPENHRARAIWEFISKMDLDACYNDIETVENRPGRTTTCPKVLFCLWVYSIVDGNISARKLDELCQYHTVYRWIAGGVPINRTMLADFRSKNPEKFEDLLVASLATMVKAGVLTDQDFSQDGTRVKASAGAGSFRREETLIKIQNEVEEYIKKLQLELQKDPTHYDTKKLEREKNIAEERAQRIREALEQLDEFRKKKVEQGKKSRETVTEEALTESRISTTDPEARKMKMGDGGFRPAFNVQFATGVQSRVIYGVDVINTLDPGTAPGMIQKVNNLLDYLNMPRAKNWNADAAYSSKEDVEKVNELYPECNYNTPPKPKKNVDPKEHQKNDSESVKKWRNRIGTPEMMEAYKHRCSTAEFSNAQVKNHGLTEILVGGLKKALGMVNLHVIANNILRYFDLTKKRDQKTIVAT